jgi:hypothetical protein
MGLFDPDSMTQTFTEAAAKYRNGISFFNIFTFLVEDFNSHENLEAGKSMQRIFVYNQLNLTDTILLNTPFSFPRCSESLQMVSIHQSTLRAFPV